MQVLALLCLIGAAVAVPYIPSTVVGTEGLVGGVGGLTGLTGGIEGGVVGRTGIQYPVLPGFVGTEGLGVEGIHYPIVGKVGQVGVTEGLRGMPLPLTTGQQYVSPVYPYLTRGYPTTTPVVKTGIQYPVLEKVTPVEKTPEVFREIPVQTQVPYMSQYYGKSYNPMYRAFPYLFQNEYFNYPMHQYQSYPEFFKAFPYLFNKLPITESSYRYGQEYPTYGRHFGGVHYPYETYSTEYPKMFNTYRHELPYSFRTGYPVQGLLY